MNKNELISVVAEKAGLSKTDATKAVDAVFEGIEAALKKHGEFRNVGFGTFHVVKRGASVGRNPRTGEEINIPESKQVKFKAGAGLSIAVTQIPALLGIPGGGHNFIERAIAIASQLLQDA